MPEEKGNGIEEKENDGGAQLRLQGLALPLSGLLNVFTPDVEPENGAISFPFPHFEETNLTR